MRDVLRTGLIAAACGFVGALLAAQGAWTGGMPAFWLDASGL